MGQEIERTGFTAEDFAAFDARLKAETALLHDWFREAAFSTRDRVGGFELEAWLVDAMGRPAPINARVLEALDDPAVVPELARFNIEFNSRPRALHGDGLSRMLEDLERMYGGCGRVAESLGAGVLMIGILPSLQEADLKPENMSEQKRYRALNDQVFRQRNGAPLRLNIIGNEHLHTLHADVMLESAATSFQIHLKAAPARAVALYNLAQVLSAPMVALSANSPFLFGRDLWSETRIPLFEQAVAVGGIAAAASGPLRRVGFGSGYARASLFECFQENLEQYPVLLPVCSEAESKQLEHVRLHNGTIWRWNRPLIGFDADGTPHLRIEHRVMPSGPTLIDAMANAAFFFGLMQRLGNDDSVVPAELLPFGVARDNFYAAARDGLDARILWSNQRKLNARTLILEALLPLAREGLEQLTVTPSDQKRFLDIVRRRTETGVTGAAWQRAYVARHGRNWEGLTQAYREQQDSGRPVHEWRT
ncbi:MAG: glutamate-cysteine ligase family protein [Thiohalobacteraceae bacterium]